jgi:hypothetical protein
VVGLGVGSGKERKIEARPNLPREVALSLVEEDRAAV